MSTFNIIIVILIVASWPLMLTRWWYDREVRFEEWLERKFGEKAPMRLAMATLAVIAPLAVYWWVSDFRRLWGL